MTHFETLTSEGVPSIVRGAMEQEEFTRLYDRLWKYAFARAKRYFKDFVLREDAASEAVNTAVDRWLEEDCYDEDTAKRVIQSSLRQASRKRELEPIAINDEELRGFHGYEIKGTK